MTMIFYWPVLDLSMLKNEKVKSFSYVGRRTKKKKEVQKGEILYFYAYYLIRKNICFGMVIMVVTTYSHFLIIMQYFLDVFEKFCINAIFNIFRETCFSGQCLSSYLFIYHQLLPTTRKHILKICFLCTASSFRVMKKWLHCHNNYLSPEA